MRLRRLKPSSQDGPALYHCLSRVVDRQFLFHAQEKAHFFALLRELEAFCEVRVLTYCILSNHFHLLVEVPRRPQRLPSAEEMIAKLSRLSGHPDLEGVRQRFEMFRRHHDLQGEAEYLARLHGRLYDLSVFMKLLKQRFSRWYNQRVGRHGTLWEERFKSVLVEGAGRALLAMAGYIDLNPVRAGLVEDPKDYGWSGYGEAVRGSDRARRGVQTLVTALLGGREESLERSLEIYRMHVFQAGSEEREAFGEDGRPVRRALSREAVAQVLRNKGRLNLAEYLRCRVRYFCDGTVFGSREFVEGVFQQYRQGFGPKRKSGARPVRGLAAPEPQDRTPEAGKASRARKADLFTLRELRRNVIGP